MKHKAFTKLYFLVFTLLSVGLFSCVNNEDEPDKGGGGGNGRDAVELNKTNLAGKWEIYYFYKEVQSTSGNANINSTYRFPENDGFTVTFKTDGSYFEQNVFGDITMEGTYTIGKREAGDSRDNMLYLNYLDSLGKPAVAEKFIPLIYDETFTDFLPYHGTVENLNINFNVLDIRYYRNLERAPNYVDESLKKNVVKLTKEDLVGLWEFNKFEKGINGNLHWVEKGGRPSSSVVAKEAEEMGQQYLFEIGQKDSLIYYEFLANESSVAERRGHALIVDDVLHFYWKGDMEIVRKDKDGNEFIEIVEDTVQTYMWWIKDKSKVSSSGNTVMISYDKYRDIQNILNEIEEKSYYEKIGKTKASSYNRSSEIRVRPIARVIK